MSNLKMTMSDLKPIAIVLYTIMISCFASYAVAETTMVKNFAVFFLLISMACLSVCFFFCQARQTQSTEAYKKSNNTNIQPGLTGAQWEKNDIARICASYRSGMRRDISLVKNDLKQIKQLVRSAVSELTDNFYNISSNVDNQQQLMDIVIDAAQGEKVETTSSQIKIISQKIKHDSGNCIRSLQFEDILTQVAEHSGLYLDDMEKYFTNLENAVEAIQRSDAQNLNDNHLGRYLSDLKTMRENLRKQNRTNIIQNNLSEGNIELF